MNAYECVEEILKKGMTVVDTEDVYRIWGDTCKASDVNIVFCILREKYNAEKRTQFVGRSDTKIIYVFDNPYREKKEYYVVYRINFEEIHEFKLTNSIIKMEIATFVHKIPINDTKQGIYLCGQGLWEELIKRGYYYNPIEDKLYVMRIEHLY